MQDVRSTGGANKGRLPPVLISHFDLTACYSCSRNVEFEERLVKHLLELSPGGAPSDTKDRASLKKCLEEHLRRAASLPQPKLSREASFLLQRYYLVSIRAMYRDSPHYLQTENGKCCSILSRPGTPFSMWQAAKPFCRKLLAWQSLRNREYSVPCKL